MMMMAGIGCSTPAARPSATRMSSTSSNHGLEPPTTPPNSRSDTTPT